MPHGDEPRILLYPFSFSGHGTRCSMMGYPNGFQSIRFDLNVSETYRLLPRAHRSDYFVVSLCANILPLAREIGPGADSFKEAVKATL